MASCAFVPLEAAEGVPSCVYQIFLSQSPTTKSSNLVRVVVSYE